MDSKRVKFHRIINHSILLYLFLFHFVQRRNDRNMDYHRIPYFLFFNCNFIKSKLHIPYSHHFLCVEHYREPILKNIQKNHR